MPGLDTRFIPLFYLQDVLVNKTTGQFLNGGEVDFYSDNSRNVPKQVYEISGVAPNYSYTAIGSQLFLSSVGTFVDGSGNDIVPYLFPYDGNATTSTGKLDLYYIVVKDSSGNPQFTREGVPNLGTSGGGGNATQVKNFAPNGQFLLHNNNITIPTGNTIPYGTPGTLDQSVPAPGGWFYERSSVSTATDAITFTVPSTQFNPGPQSQGASPRFAMNINRSVGGGNNETSQLSLRFMDVNKFYGQSVTLLFSAVLNSGTTLPNVNVYELDYYGTNLSGSGTASPTVYTNQTPASPITITNNYQQFAVSFTCNANPTNTFGADNNDFVEFCIVFPPGTPFNVQITDMILVLGVANGTSSPPGTAFPITNNGQFIIDAMDSLAPTSTNPLNSAGQTYYPQDGSNLYLPIIMTPSGFTYDYGQIGKVTAGVYPTAHKGELLCDGTQYTKANYSSDGIPYARLFNVLFNNGNSLNIPIFGTGSTYSTAYINSASQAQIVLTANALGANAHPADGTSAPGFSYGTPFTGTTTINYKAYANSNAVVTAISTFTNGCNNNNRIQPGTSGMTVTDTHQAFTVTGGMFYEFTVTALSAATLANPGGAGKYFTFSNHTTDYAIWFFFTNETPPVIVGAPTLIKIDLSKSTTMAAADIANIIANVIGSQQVDTITVGAASTITSGNYFTFATNAGGTTYKVWYNKAGAGGGPTGNLIEVDLTGSETAAQVASKTQIAINSQFFCVPDFRGVFLRGLDSASPVNWDIDVATRFGVISAIAGASIGSFELDNIYVHKHTIERANNQDNNGTVASKANNGAGGDNFSMQTGAFPDSTQNNVASTGTESRPVNVAVNWFIKY